MICPNCKQEFEGGRCPNCGRPTFRAFGRIAAVVVLLLVTIPAALVGACSAIVGIQSATDRYGGGYWLISAFVGAVALVVFAGSVALVKKLWG